MVSLHICSCAWLVIAYSIVVCKYVYYTLGLGELRHGEARETFFINHVNQLFASFAIRFTSVVCSYLGYIKSNDD